MGTGYPTSDEAKRAFFCDPCKKYQSRFDKAFYALWDEERQIYECFRDIGEVLQEMHQKTLAQPLTQIMGSNFCNRERPSKKEPCNVSLYNMEELERRIRRSRWLEGVFSLLEQEEARYVLSTAKERAENGIVNPKTLEHIIGSVRPELFTREGSDS